MISTKYHENLEMSVVFDWGGSQGLPSDLSNIVGVEFNMFPRKCCKHFEYLVVVGYRAMVHRFVQFQVSLFFLISASSKDWTHFWASTRKHGTSHSSSDISQGHHFLQPSENQLDEDFLFALELKRHLFSISLAHGQVVINLILWPTRFDHGGIRPYHFIINITLLRCYLSTLNVLMKMTHMCLTHHILLYNVEIKKYSTRSRLRYS